MSAVTAPKVSFPGQMTMSSGEYHAHSAVGSSSLRTILKRSPAHYLYDRQNPSEPTPAMKLGTAIHHALLEPAMFSSAVAVQPKFSGKGAVERKEQWAIENHGKLIITEDQLEVISGIRKAVSSHKHASSILAGGAAEGSYFWQDAETGVYCKCRPDFLREGRVVVDVKSTLDASYKSFQRDMAKYMYHVQAAFYLDGISQVLGQNHDTFLILAVEKAAPFGVHVFELDEGAIDAGRQEYKRALRILKECQVSQQYQCYPDKLTPMALPAWAYPGDDE